MRPRITFAPRAASVALAITSLALPLSHGRLVAQSQISVGPFITLSPGSASLSGGAGLSLAASSGPLGFRASGYASLDDQLLSERGWRPWGFDGDLIISTSGMGGVINPYIFGGVGLAGRDSLRSMVAHGEWSYGAGISIPIAGAMSLMGESRTRNRGAPWPHENSGTGSVRELRIGATLGFGGGARRNSSPVSRAPNGGRAGTTAARVLPTAEDYLGVPYVWGGTSPTSGFDCSGFTQFVFAKHQVNLPRTSRQQATAGMKVATDWSELLPGDLVMFADPGEAISHVAIYAGDDRIIHSTSSGGGVRYDDLSTRRGQWFAENIVAARRITPDGRGLMLDFAKAFAGVIAPLDPPR